MKPSVRQMFTAAATIAVLTGCTAPAIQAGTSDHFQDTVRQIAQLTSDGDSFEAADLAGRLKEEVQAAQDQGEVSPGRASQIQDNIDSLLAVLQPESVPPPENTPSAEPADPPSESTVPTPSPPASQAPAPSQTPVRQPAAPLPPLQTTPDGDDNGGDGGTDQDNSDSGPGNNDDDGSNDDSDSGSDDNGGSGQGRGRGRGGGG